jgi:tetratricopeptide (TPR) repeat protein
MSSPAETQTPTTGFDPLVFWIRYKNSIVLLSGLLLVGLVVFGISEVAQRREAKSAADLFGSAKTVEEYKNVAVRYPRSPVATNATLLLAEELRNEGKYEEALEALKKQTEQKAAHPLISGLWNSIAMTQEAQGKQDEALATYQKVSTTYPTSFSAPVALLAQARIQKAKGQNQEAGRLYDQVIASFGDSNFAREAIMESQKLKAPEPDGPAESKKDTGQSGTAEPGSLATPAPEPTPANAPAESPAATSSPAQTAPPPAQ